MPSQGKKLGVHMCAVLWDFEGQEGNSLEAGKTDVCG